MQAAEEFGLPPCMRLAMMPTDVACSVADEDTPVASTSEHALAGEGEATPVDDAETPPEEDETPMASSPPAALIPAAALKHKHWDKSLGLQPAVMEAEVNAGAAASSLLPPRRVPSEEDVAAVKARSSVQFGFRKRSFGQVGSGHAQTSPWQFGSSPSATVGAHRFSIEGGPAAAMGRGEMTTQPDDAVTAEAALLQTETQPRSPELMPPPPPPQQFGYKRSLTDLEGDDDGAGPSQWLQPRKASRFSCEDPR